MKNQINLEVNDLFTEKLNQRKQINFWSRIGFMCLLLFTFNMSQAQTETQEKENIIVQGNVSDETGALTDVNIVLEGTNIGTATDSKGNFKFPKALKKGDVLVFSSIGLKSQKIVIDNTNSASNVELKVDMALTTVTIMGSATSKKAFRSKRK